MALFCPLFSGSTGNCTFISSNEKFILIDAGVSCKKITEAVNNLDKDIKLLSAIFITHEHIDHIQGLKTLVKKVGCPVYCSNATAEKLNEHFNNEIDIIGFDNYISVNDFIVKRFATSHDCEGSSGYRITTPDNKQIAVCTDLGYISDEVEENLENCDLVMLESNHEVSMLESGPYPYTLKKRVLSDCGHLSNSCCAEELLALIKNGCKRFVIAHLSRENNHPLIASQCIETTLKMAGFERNSDYILEVAPQSGGKIMVI